MTPLRLAVFALAASVLLGGCYKYDMRATNSAGQDVRITLVKGRRHKELSTVVLGAGSSVGWAGAARRPILLRIRTDAGTGNAVEITVPRKIHTEFEVMSESGQLVVTSDQPTMMSSACCTDGSCAECQALEAESGEPMAEPMEEYQVDEPAPAPPATDRPAVDLIESDGG